MSKLSDYEITEEDVFRATIDSIIKNGDWEFTQVRDGVVDELLIDSMNLDDVQGNRDLVKQVEEIIEKYREEIDKLTNLITEGTKRLVD
jgi:hypothetical protein